VLHRRAASQAPTKRSVTSELFQRQPGGLSEAQQEDRAMTKSKHIPDAIRERDALDRIAQARAYVFAAHDVIGGLSDKSKAAKVSLALIAADQHLNEAVRSLH
jgi:hypothetical protein